MGVTLLKILGRLPYRVQWAIGCGIGYLVPFLMRDRSAVARRNIEICFAELSELERKALLSRHFRSLGLFVVELVSAWFASDKKIARLCSIKGAEKFAIAQQRGQGILLASAHFSSTEIGARRLGQEVCFSGMYRRHKNPVFEDVVLRARLGFTRQMIPRSGLRQTIRLLRNGGILWFGPDQEYRRGDSTFAPFFGISAKTTLTPHRLAKTCGCALYSMAVRRTAPARYEVEIDGPYEDFPTADPTADAARVNAIIEEKIRLAPDQYLWVHRRFKSRPEGESPIY